MSKKKKTIEELLGEALVSEEEQPYKLPENWVWVNLKYLLSSLETGKRPKGGVSEIREGVPSLGGEHLNYNGGFNLENIKFVPVDFAASMTKGIIKENDILIVKDGATTGKTAFVSSDFPFEKAVVNEHVFICRSSEKICSKFLFYYILSLHGQKSIKDNLKGSAQGGINTSFVNKFPIPLATLNEQKRIAEKVERLLRKIDEAKQLIEEAKETFELRRAAILNKAFRGELTRKWRNNNNVSCENKIDDSTDAYPSLPNGWKWVKLSDIIQMQNGLSKRKGTNGKLVAVLRLADINGNEFVDTDLRKIMLSEKEVEKYRLNKDDILFIRVNGSFDLVGKAIHFNLSQEAAYCDHLIRGTFDKKLINTLYIKYLFDSPLIRNQLADKIVSSAGQNTISQGSLGSLVIPLPSKEEQDEIVRILDEIFSKDDNAKTEQHLESKLDLIKQSILSKAFRGELGTNDPSEENSIELLKEVLHEQVK